MMTEQEQQLLEAIKGNPRDWDLRKILADFLEENDRPAEADWHRGWDDRKQDAYERLETWAGLLEAYSVEALLDEPKYYIDNAVESVSEEREEEFWNDWSLVTGKGIPVGRPRDPWISACGCGDPISFESDEEGYCTC